jgi:hypothetical protein
LPSGKFPRPTPTDSEEQFGRLKFGADWVGQLKTDELTILDCLRPRWEGYADVWGDRVDPGRTEWRYDGPEELLPVAEKVMERAARGNEQLAYVRRGLALLERFGAGDAPPPGTPYRYAFDPLDPVAKIDRNDRELLIEFRLFYWRFRADAAAPVTGTDEQRRGRKPVYDREFLRRQVFELMNHHGDFLAGDRDWGSQADLERAVQAKFQAEFGSEPATSTIRKLIAEPLKEWRRRRTDAADN